MLPLLCALQLLHVTASSELAGKGRYAPKNAVDGDPKTAWVEGVKGLGEGETLTVQLAAPAQVAGFVLVPGYARSIEHFVQNGAPSRLELSADGEKLLDLRVPYVETRPEGAERCLRLVDAVNLSPRLVVLSKPVTARAFTLRLAAVSAGTKFDDTAISEFVPLPDRAPAALQQAFAALIALRDGQPPLADGARADPLLPWPAQGEFPEYERLVAPGAGLPPLQAFLKVLGPAMLDRAVLVAGRRLVGGMAYTHGDGEWQELYPELVLDAQGRIAELRRAFHEDAAPGCRNALPPKL